MNVIHCSLLCSQQVRASYCDICLDNTFAKQFSTRWRPKRRHSLKSQLIYQSVVSKTKYDCKKIFSTFEIIIHFYINYLVYRGLNKFQPKTMFQHLGIDVQIILKCSHNIQNLSQIHLHVWFYLFILDNLSVTIYISLVTVWRVPTLQSTGSLISCVFTVEEICLGQVLDGFLQHAKWISYRIELCAILTWKPFRGQ